MPEDIVTEAGIGIVTEDGTQLVTDSLAEVGTSELLADISIMPALQAEAELLPALFGSIDIHG